MIKKIILAVEEQIKAAEESKLREEKSEKIVRKLKAEQRVIHNTIQELRGNVRVFARVRPFLPNDGVPISTEPSIIIKNDNGLQLVNICARLRILYNSTHCTNCIFSYLIFFVFFYHHHQQNSVRKMENN